MMNFRKVFFFVLLTILLTGINLPSYSQPVKWADSCQSTSFVGFLIPSQVNGFSSFQNVYEYPNGDIAAIGAIQGLTDISENQYGLVSRISKTGQVIWTKYIGLDSPPEFNVTSIYASIVTSTEDIICITNTSRNLLGGNDIVKLDAGGNLLWKKRLPYLDFNEILEHIIETADGGFLICGVASNIGVIIKINNQGDLLWRRIYSNSTYANCRSVAESPSAYYFTGYTYTFGFSSSANMLVKINKNDGGIIWIKGFGNATQAEGLSEYGYDRMIFKDSLLYLQGSTNSNYTGSNRAASSEVIFNENGIIVGSKRIENVDINMEKSLLFRGRTYDHRTHSGVHFDNVVAAGGDLSIYRLDNQYNPLLTWRLPSVGFEYAKDFLVQKDSSIVISGHQINTAFTGGSALIVKTAPSGVLNNCSTIPSQVIVSNPVIPTGNITIATNPSQTNPTTASALPVFFTIAQNWQLNCYSETSCKLSKINGIDTVCEGSTSLYKITRGGACTNSVSFISNDPGVLVQPVSDTSVSISFSMAGVKKIFASMGSECGVLKDSIEVIVIPVKPPVNLGNDLYLCASSITLHAGSGYKSYIWGNNTIDSILTVTLPGKYYITVNDYCNNISSDTIEILPAPPINYNLGNDTSICNSDTLTLYAPIGFHNYQWAPSYNMIHINDSTVKVFPSRDTFYISIAEKFTGCIVSDTIRIKIHSPSYVSVGKDTSICKDKSLLLTASPGFSTYVWSTGATESFIQVQQQGNYSVIAKDINGCASFDTVKVTVNNNPAPVISDYSNICKNAPRILSLPISYSSYLWQNNSIQPTYIATDTGWYYVKVSDVNGCTGTDTSYLREFAIPPFDFLLKDSTICSYETINLKPTAQYLSYNWSTGSLMPSITVSQKGLYWLEVEDSNNCIGRDTASVKIKQCEQMLFFPSGFTPNQDGLNDFFIPKVKGQLETYNLKIYNRWGEIIFESSLFNKGWNGNYLSNYQRSDVFVFVCNYKFPNEPSKQSKGTFILIR